MSPPRSGKKHVPHTKLPSSTDGIPTSLRVIEGGLSWSVERPETGVSVAKLDSVALVEVSYDGGIRIMFGERDMQMVLHFAPHATTQLLSWLAERGFTFPHPSENDSTNLSDGG